MEHNSYPIACLWAESRDELRRETAIVQAVAEVLRTKEKDPSRRLCDALEVLSQFEDSSAPDPLFYLGTPQALRLWRDRAAVSFLRLPRCVILLPEDQWDQDVKSLIQDPRLMVLGIFRLQKREVLRAEDLAALADTAKDEIRRRLRSQGVSECDPRLSKALDWKCRLKEEERQDNGFFSFFTDPAMALLCETLKGTVRSCLPQVKRLEKLCPFRGPQQAASEAPGALFQNLPKEPFRPPSILLMGESGAGKSLAAAWIAETLELDMAALNIGALSKNMVDLELFGAVKGSYTGADSDKAGIFQNNQGRLVFLDEIGDLDPECQVRLLRYLDSSEIQPMGWSAQRRIYAPAAIVAATNRPLDRWAGAGGQCFRSDLLFRFDHVISIPPLRERRQDLRLLISLTLQDRKINPGWVEQISIDAIEELERRDYPGNFRDLRFQLRTAVQNAMRDCCKTLCRRHLP